jgi:tetratricopeptide (TPR) repeat protein
MGRADDAERLLKQVIASEPRRADDALLLGDLYMRSADYADAIDWLGKAERIQPGARPELLMALSYQHLKKMDLANQYLELAKQHAPDNPDVQRAMAGYYREAGNYSEAIAALKSIRKPKPDVIAELAYTLQLDGKLSDSARLYEEAANAAPKDLDLQLSAAQAEFAGGSIEKANSQQAWMSIRIGCTQSAERLRDCRSTAMRLFGNTVQPWLTCPQVQRRGRSMESNYIWT